MGQFTAVGRTTGTTPPSHPVSPRLQPRSQRENRNLPREGVSSASSQRWGRCSAQFAQRFGLSIALPRAQPPPAAGVQLMGPTAAAAGVPLSLLWQPGGKGTVRTETPSIQTKLNKLNKLTWSSSVASYDTAERSPLHLGAKASLGEPQNS